MGFVGPERTGLLEQLGVELDERGNVARDDDWRDQRRPACSSAGDMGRGQSLIVWAIAEGRAARGRRRRVPHGQHRPPVARRPTDRPLG